MDLLSIDPGFTGTGLAVWSAGDLYCAYVIRPEGSTLVERIKSLYRQVHNYNGSDAREYSLIIEQPQTYGGRAAKGDANDLIKLANLVGALSTLADEVELVAPAKWKGQAPASVVEARCRKKLTDAEKLRIELPRNAKHRTDVWHAIGLGLWKLGR